MSFLINLYSHVRKIIESTLVFWLQFFYLTNISRWILLMWRYCFLFYCVFFQVHCYFLHYTWWMWPILRLCWLFMRGFLLLLLSGCFSIFAQFKVTLWRGLLLLSSCCIFWSGHANFRRTKDTVHESIRTSLSLVSFGRFFLP